MMPTRRTLFARQLAKQILMLTSGTADAVTNFD
jgi:hypothetical protein